MLGIGNSLSSSTAVFMMKAKRQKEAVFVLKKKMSAIEETLWKGGM